MNLWARLLKFGKGSKKIEWILPFVRNRTVLDIGCAGMDELAYKANNWLHHHIV